MKLIRVCSKNNDLEFVVKENIKKIMISKDSNQRHIIIFKVTDKHDILSYSDGTPHTFDSIDSAQQHLQILLNI